MSERAKLQKKKVTEDLLDSLLLLPPWRNFAISQSHQSIIESSSQRLPEKMRIDENEGVSASSKHLVFAYYVTGHGFGHATRVVEVPSPSLTLFLSASVSFLIHAFCFPLSL